MCTADQELGTPSISVAPPTAAPVVPSDTRPTPLPLMKMFALTLVLMNEAICATMLMPFVGFFVASLTNTTKEHAGYTSGFLLSMFMIGQILSLKFWGRLSDIYGRRPIILYALGVSAVIVVLFGLSMNVYQAMFFRFVHGLVNGNVAIAKVVIAEVTDRTNESKGFALIGFAWSVGTLFGPVLGGFLYDPAGSGKFDWLGLSGNALFTRFPALLPCLVLSVYSVIAMVIVSAKLPETNLKARPLREFWARILPRRASASPLAPSASTAELQLTQSSSSAALEPPSKHTYGFKDVMMHPDTRRAVLLYVSLCGADYGFDEIFPLWAISSLRSGGLDLAAADIGVIYILSGVAGVVANLTFPLAIQWCGSRLRFWKFSVVATAITYAAIPFAPALVGTRSTAIIVVVSLQLARIAVLSWAFATVFLFIAAVAPEEHLGVMNAASMAFGGVLRAITPLVVTPLFALSIDHPKPHFFFGYYTTFIILALTLLYGYYQSVGFNVTPRERKVLSESQMLVQVESSDALMLVPSSGVEPTLGEKSSDFTVVGFNGHQPPSGMEILLSGDAPPATETAIEMATHTLHMVEGETSPTVPIRGAAPPSAHNDLSSNHTSVDQQAHDPQ